MSEPQLSRKKSKKKKKPSVNGNSTTDAKSVAASKSDSTQKLDTVFDKVLPQKVGMTTKIKDIEVTLTNNGNETVNGTSKKKKKKKKSKQQAKETAEESLSSEGDAQKLLNFNADHIELVNHPEISVTISSAPSAETKVPLSFPDKADSVPQAKETTKENNSSTASKKKKKKKKKKNIENGVTPNPSAPSEPTDDAQSAPTYVKLPTDGGNCVLLVSHESFSNGSKQSTSNSNLDSQIKPPNDSNKSETVEASKVPSNDLKIENGNSVSIFPVYTDQNKNKNESKDFNVKSSLNKISNMINETEESSNNNPDVPKLVNEDKQNEDENKTKAQLKAERRAKQEAQRAAKLAKSSEKDSNQASKEQGKTQTNVKDPLVKQSVNETSQIQTSQSKDTSKVPVDQELCRKVQIFSHLPQYQDYLSKKMANSQFKIPSQILELGSHYSKGTLCGSNARCVGFLAAFRQVILDHKTPPNKIFLKDLESKFQTYLDFLGNCRPLSVSIVNAMKFLKHQINHMSEDMNEENIKDSLCESINNYVREEILLAKEAITISASAKIVDNDIILVFAYSSLVKEVLCKAYDQKKSFRVIVVDSRAKMEGLEMLRRLVKYGLQCSYISINAVPSVIKKVNKVIIGAHALLANGFVMSRLGCKILSLIGSTYSVPVLVCCETYKFWERSLTDSIVHNELGNPDDLVTSSLDKKNSLLKWNELPSLQIYNLLYDVTPSDFISVVITEKGLIPCTSVPVLLRVKHAGLRE